MKYDLAAIANQLVEAKAAVLALVAIPNQKSWIAGDVTQVSEAED
jgi:hypothetical protein